MPRNQQKAAPKPIVIVGGGFAGSAVLIHTLLKIAEDDTLTSPVQITMLERKPEQLHAGLAYGKAPEYRKHNLNIGSKRVNPFPAGQNPPGFPTFVQYIEDLARRNPEMAQCLTNPPRQLFGDYVHHLVGLAVEKAGRKAQVETVYKNATGLKETASGAHIECSDGTSIAAARVILATGFQDALAPKFARAVEGSPRFLDTPYSKKANRFFDKVVADKGASVLIIGTGLTAMDTAVRLVKSGFKGSISMMSRRSLMHKPYAPTPLDEYRATKLRGEPRPEAELPFTKKPPAFMRAKSAQGLVTSAVREFTKLTREGYSTEEVLNYWERFVPAVAGKFPKAELARYLSANEALITTNRVGVTPDIGVIIRKAMETGQIHMTAGTIFNVQQEGGKMVCEFSPADGSLSLGLGAKFAAGAQPRRKATHDYIISAMGNSINYDPARDEIRDPLWKSLLEKGKAAPHWTKMGVAVNDDFALLDAEGRPSRRISVIGAPVAGHMMVTPYKYPEKPGSGGRLGPPAMSVVGITGATLAFLAQEYESLTSGYRDKRAKTPKPAPLKARA